MAIDENKTTGDEVTASEYNTIAEHVNNFSFGTPSDGQLLQWDNANGYFTSVSLSSINVGDFNNNVGYITDYTVTETDVTQHESALTLTESQISDLDHYTSTDFDTDFGTKSTTDLSEGANLYYTETRVSNNTDVSSNTTHRNSTGNPHSTTLEDVRSQANGLSGAINFSGNDAENLRTAHFNVHDNGNSGASITVDFANGSFQKMNLDQNTSLTLSAPAPGRYQLYITGGGSYSVSYSTSVTWLTSGGSAPSLNGTDIETFYYDGTTWYGTHSNNA